ncbi:MAG: hypothetical protein SV062_11160 [Thermodesulfobacteriota bacterium]|nr:hypothetical protein [Thermodesulfobacteriota bacterium]
MSHELGLKGKKEICYILKSPTRSFEKWLELGLPVKKLCGSWYGHTDEIYDFLKKKIKE